MPSGFPDRSSEVYRKRTGCQSRWKAFSKSMNVEEGNSDPSSEELDKEMSMHDVTSLRMCSTLDRSEWVGCKRRRVGVRETKLKKHDKQFFESRRTYPVDKENMCGLPGARAKSMQKNMEKSFAKIENRNPQGMIDESETGPCSSKWAAFKSSNNDPDSGAESDF